MTERTLSVDGRFSMLNSLIEDYSGKFIDANNLDNVRIIEDAGNKILFHDKQNQNIYYIANINAVNRNDFVDLCFNVHFKSLKILTGFKDISDSTCFIIAAYDDNGNEALTWQQLKDKKYSINEELKVIKTEIEKEYVEDEVLEEDVIEDNVIKEDIINEDNVIKEDVVNDDNIIKDNIINSDNVIENIPIMTTAIVATQENSDNKVIIENNNASPSTQNKIKIKEDVKNNMDLKDVIKTFFPETNIMFISIAKSIKNSNSIYDATRKSWKIKMNKAMKTKVVIAEIKGEPVAMFNPTKWVESKDNVGRIEFEGEELPMIDGLNKIKINKAKGSANPIRYGF